MIEGCRLYEGRWWVPDDELDRALRRRLKDVARVAMVAEYCERHRVVLQGGANWGPWPLALSGIFSVVLTFEPDERLFCAMTANTTGVENIVRFQAALGDRHEMVGLKRYAGKSGKTHLDGAGGVPMIRIDDLGLRTLDAILLDIEGCEHAALTGARETIERCRPVILAEDKGWSERFGQPIGAVAQLLEGMGYRVAQQIGRDTVMVPA